MGEKTDYQRLPCKEIKEEDEVTLLSVYSDIIGVMVLCHRVMLFVFIPHILHVILLRTLHF